MSVREFNMQDDELSAAGKLDPAKGIKRILRPREKDLGEFTVRRVLPSGVVPMVGPWIFFDHMGPATFEPGTGVNVRPHPHINLATVTYLFEGEILHRDSLGNEQKIRPGDINLMMAGAGIVHSERESDDVRQSRHALHGLQLWLALPEDDEETDPVFIHYPGDDIPAIQVAGVSVRVMMGSAYDVESPVKTYAETLYIEAKLDTGQTLALPPAQERAVYIASGAATLSGASLNTCEMAVLTDSPDLQLTATKPTRLALIGGEKLGKRFIEWNFVSSRRERIEQAKQNWRNGDFPKVPGDEKEFIPLP